MKHKIKWLALTVLLAVVVSLTGLANGITIDSHGFLSISSNMVIAAQMDNSQPISSFKATYVSPTVTELATNLFEINFTGSKNKVHIGTGTNSFISRMLFGAWDDECLIDLQMEDITGNLGKATLTGEGENASITIENNSWKLEYKPVPPTAGFNEYGGIDYIMTLKRRTSYNQINFTFNPTNCIAYHQPPLTQEFTDGWSDEFQCEISVTETTVTRVSDGEILVHRPEHVVNSIVFYHAAKGGTVTHTDADRGITTGKIGTLYRLRVTDASNNQTWADWSLSGNIITLTIPLPFLQSATFPVVISPVSDTFGYTSAGSSNVTPTAERLYNSGIGYSPASNGTGDNIIAATYNSGNTLELDAGLYNGTDLIDNGQTQNDTSWVGEGNELSEMIFATSPSVLAAVSYYISVRAETNRLDFFRYDSHSESYYIKYADTTWDNALPDPITWTTSGTSKRNYSFYCTYTPLGGFDISNTPDNKAFGIVACSGTYYAKGSPPSNPVEDGDCTFTITNNGASACDLDMKVSDFTGGVGWNIGAPAENQCRITVYYSGQNPASGLVLTNDDQEFYDGLAGSATIKWDFKFETPTSVTDGVAKEAILTITAVAED